MDDIEETDSILEHTTTTTSIPKERIKRGTTSCCCIILASMQITTGLSIIGSGVAYNVVLPDLGYWWCFFTGGLLLGTGVVGVVAYRRRTGSSDVLDGAYLSLNIVFKVSFEQFLYSLQISISYLVSSIIVYLVYSEFWKRMCSHIP